MDYERLKEIIIKWFEGSNHQLWATVFAIIVLYIASKVLQKALLYRMDKLEERHKVRRSVAWGTLLAFIICLAIIWAPQGSDIGVFLGIIGAGVALSMQEMLLSMAGWLLLVFKKPIDIGDRIEIQDQIGDVIDIGIFQTSLLEVGNWVGADQSTGRLLVVPNSAFIRHSIHNYTKGFPFVWNEIPVTVTFESNWREAKSIMLEEAMHESDKTEQLVNKQITSMQNEYAIHYDRLTPTVYTDIGASGVVLTLRYLTPVRSRRTTNHRISEDILDKMIKHPNIDFAYPTTRIFRNNEEGKEKLRP